MDSEASLPLTRLPTRKIKKEGYLSKQGGQNQDKGWTKRYVRFDGHSLRYYTDEKSVQSLRIIPVAIMQEACHEEGRNSTNLASGILANPSRAHKFTLKTVKRTFLFATDNHDNCVQWISFLTEAIINQSREGSADDAPVAIGGSMFDPDIQGTIKLKNKEFHAALKGNVFRYYPNKDEYEIDCPIHELFMQVTNVAKDGNAAVKLRSVPDQTHILQFDSPVEADRWHMYFTEASENIGDDSIVNQIKVNPDNRTCVDCTAKETNWASINLGVVLCIKCAGVHRGLGVNYSKVRSLRMDHIFRENAHLLQLFVVIGNKNANAYWYANPVPNREINTDTPECIRQKHIQQKYVRKDFVEKSTIDSISLNEDFIGAVRQGDVLGAMRLYESGADMFFTDGDLNKDAISIAKHEGHVVLLEYLEHNKSRIRESSRGLKTEVNTQTRRGLHHDGYLEKTGPKMKGFLKRWFVLHYNQLTYYDDKKGQNNPKEKGSIDLDHVTCVAITECTNRRFCFDVTCKAKKRLYRLAAPGHEERRQWMDNLLQIIRPECVADDEIYTKLYSIAGFFYVQQHSQGHWLKTWLGIGMHSIDVIYMNKSPQHETFPIDQEKLKVYKYNASSSSKMLDDDVTLKQLDTNKAVELQIDQRVVRIQGYHPEDTEKLFNILTPSLTT